MAIPVLKLNLVPSPTLWRQRHEALGWTGLVLGILALGGSLTAWGIQAARTKRAVKESIQLSNQAKEAARKEASLQQELATLDIARELPRWRLAERIYLERGLPWSRATSELERSLVDGVRIKALSRARSADGTVELKIRGESRSREAEVQFVENLQKNGLFTQVVLEREAERPGGGLEFELRLPMIATPPPYQPLPVLKPVSSAPVQPARPLPRVAASPLIRATWPPKVEPLANPNAEETDRSPRRPIGRPTRRRHE